ncbi:MAG: hypothetical protein H6709_20275 [Kofleriaceae bacterium]|nr:hypothetical protein [Kofleriaceae bacterium]
MSITNAAPGWRAAAAATCARGGEVRHHLDHGQPRRPRRELDGGAGAHDHHVEHGVAHRRDCSALARLAARRQHREVSGPPYPPEWLALLEGLKPGLRLWRSAARARAEAEAGRSRGLAAELTPLGDADAIVYLARTPAAARALRDLETSILPGTTPRSFTDAVAAQHLALGLALGFPRCCVDAYLARLARGVTRARDGATAHEDFVAADDIRSRSARLWPRLNTFARLRGARWLSHDPCRFDCAPSRRYADDLAVAFTRRAPAAAADIDRHLARDVAVLRDGDRRDPGDAPPDACVLAFSKDLDPAGGPPVL